MRTRLCESCEENQGKFREQYGEYLCEECYEYIQDELGEQWDEEDENCDIFENEGGY